MDVDVLKAKDLVYILTLLCTAVGIGISFSWWFNRQLTCTKDSIHTNIREQEMIVNSHKERLALIEQSGRHQESRLDSLDDKIDVIQNDITETKAEVGRLNNKISENHLTVVGTIQRLGDKLDLYRSVHERN